jgi:hypothetical protein
VDLIHSPYADENLTISTGVKFSLGIPPIVPLKPDIDLINVIVLMGGKIRQNASI